MVRLNVNFQKVAFLRCTFGRWKYQKWNLPGHVCSENTIGVSTGGCRNNVMKSDGETESKEIVIKLKICDGCNPTLQTYEGGVGERRTQGLRVSFWARWRDAEVDEGAVLCFFFSFLFKWAIAVKSFFFFWLSSSDWRIRATWNLCKSGTIHPTKTKPHYGPAACQPDENKWVCIQKMGLFFNTRRQKEVSSCHFLTVV